MSLCHRTGTKTVFTLRWPYKVNEIVAWDQRKGTVGTSWRIKWGSRTNGVGKDEKIWEIGVKIQWDSLFQNYYPVKKNKIWNNRRIKTEDRFLPNLADGVAATGGIVLEGGGGEAMLGRMRQQTRQLGGRAHLYLWGANYVHLYLKTLIQKIPILTDLPRAIRPPPPPPPPIRNISQCHSGKEGNGKRKKGK